MKSALLGVFGLLGAGTFLAKNASPEFFGGGMGLVILGIFGTFFIAWKALK